MKKWVKVTASAVLGSAALMYAGFLFVLPNVIDLNKYKTEVQNLINEQTKLNIDFQNPKIITTPLLGAGVKADNITIKLPDDSILFSADSIKTRIALPSLFLLTVKVSCLDVEKPFINLEIKNNENFKIVQLVEDMLNEGKEQRLEEGKQTVQAEAEGLKFNPEWIRIKVPAVKLHNYRVLVNDLKSKHYLDLKGEELVLGYFNGKTAKVKTYAELYSDENKNITANVNLNTFLPEFGTKLDKEDDPAERVDIPFVNPIDATIALAPHTDKENKKVACAKSLASSAAGYFLTLLVSTPFVNAMIKIDEQPQRFLKPETINNFKKGSEKLYQSKSYTLATQLFKLGLGLIVAAPKAILTCAGMPYVMRYIFNQKNEKKPENLSFKGKGNDKLAHGIGKFLDNKGMQKFSDRYKDSNFPMHIIAATDALTTATFIHETNRSDKIEEKRKKAVIYNAGISTTLSITSSYILDGLTSKSESFISDREIPKYPHFTPFSTIK